MTKFKTLGKELFIIFTTIITLTIMIMSNNHTVYTHQDDNAEEVIGLIMKSDGTEVGIVSNEEVGNKALKIVEERYTSKIDKKDIKLVILNNKITYEEIKCAKKEISDENNLSNKIINYNNENKKNIISFTLVKENEELSVMKSSQTRSIFFNQLLHTPTKGLISSNFGARDGAIHKGIDFAANHGEPIEAALEGKVIFSGAAGTFGNAVILDNGNGIETIYAHCSKLYVNTGDKVIKGQHIADVGNTGDSTGPHLHFEVKVNGVSVDPSLFKADKQY